MSFNWAEFLVFAKALQSNPNSPGPPEAALRSAASRAYYSAFHYALNFARREGFSSTFSASDHQSVQRYFRQHKHSDRARKKVATQLDRLRRHRNEADYDDVLKRGPGSLADQAIKMAESVFGHLDSL